MYHILRCSQGGTLDVLLRVDGHLSPGGVPFQILLDPQSDMLSQMVWSETLCSQAHALQLKIATQPVCLLLGNTTAICIVQSSKLEVHRSYRFGMPACNVKQCYIDPCCCSRDHL